MRPIFILKIGGSGSGPDPVTLNSQTITANGSRSAPASAGYILGSDGKVYNQNGTQTDTWLAVGSAANYQCYASIISGSPSGSFGSWLSFSGSQTWALAGTAGQDTSAKIQVQIRDAAAPNTLRGTAIITFNCNNP